MSPVPKEVMDQIKNEIHTVLGKSASELFLHRVDAILEGWSRAKLTAAQACEKIQKLVASSSTKRKPVRLVGVVHL